MASTESGCRQRGDRLQDTLKIISGDIDVDALPDVTVADHELAAGERRQLTLDRTAPLGGLVHDTECFDLDAVKRLIGLEDRFAAEKKCFPRRRREPIPTYDPDELVRAFEASEITEAMADFIEIVARQYLFDDSSQVQLYRPIIEQVYMRGAGKFDITSVCFGTFRVRNGWTLLLSPSIQLFCAHRLLLEPQAEIRRTSNADITFNVSEVLVVDPQPSFKPNS